MRTRYPFIASRQRGATVIEYALIAALVAIVAIAGFTLVGSNVNAKMTSVGSAIGST